MSDGARYDRAGHEPYCLFHKANAHDSSVNLVIATPALWIACWRQCKFDGMSVRWTHVAPQR